MSAQLMTKYGLKTTILSVIVVVAIASLTGINTAFAEDEYPYKIAGDIHTVFTFTFKNGVEVVEFPVFNMEDDIINKNISPSFSVEGVVGESPLLHKALDEAFKYKAAPTRGNELQIFDVKIDFVKNDEILKTLKYHDCLVDNYEVKTLNDAYESYLSSSSGFAIVDDIDFLCSGLNSKQNIVGDSWRPEYTTTEYAHSPYKFADDIRTFITFEFDRGVEIIEFPSFQTMSGFEEDIKNVVPRFAVEGTIQKHILLDKAIENARENSGIPTGVNIDFEATVEFKKGSDVLRTLEYKDCRVDSAKVFTQTDKEEGFTGKSGFAYVEEIHFECIGLDTDNSSYDAIFADVPIWKSNMVENNLPNLDFPQGTGPKVIATFTYDNGIEVVDFPYFEQGSILKFVNTGGGQSGGLRLPTAIPATPSFTLEGLVRDTPMLYAQVDKNLKLSKSTGFSNFLGEFNVDVELVQGDKSVRSFNYVDCRVVDYDVGTKRNKEENYFKGFALVNTFDFECKGYHPNVPAYDQMFNTQEKAKTINSGDLRNTQSWDKGFYYEG